MAGIDKTYLNKWEDFDKVRNWALKTSFTLKNGQIVNLKDFLYYPDLTKEEWDELHDEKIKYAEEHYNNPEYIKECKELYGNEWKFNPEKFFNVVLWNTPVYVDIFLIRNCPFDFIQNRLKEQYGGGWSKQAFTDHNDDTMYEQIKNHTSIYDTYKRNGLGEKAKVKFYDYYAYRDKKLNWYVDINPYWYNNKRIDYKKHIDYWYNEDDNMFYSDLEAMPWTCSNFTYHGSLTKKNIVNLVKKWNLPKNTYIKFAWTYKHKGYEFLVKVY